MNTVPCQWCDTPTTMTGTECCDGCWELSRRIRIDPDMAGRMLMTMREEWWVLTDATYAAWQDEQAELPPERRSGAFVITPMEPGDSWAIGQVTMRQALEHGLVKGIGVTLEDALRNVK